MPCYRAPGVLLASSSFLSLACFRSSAISKSDKMLGTQPQPHRGACTTTTGCGGASVPQKKTGTVCSSLLPTGSTCSLAVVNGAAADGMAVESVSLHIIVRMFCTSNKYILYFMNIFLKYVTPNNKMYYLGFGTQPKKYSRSNSDHRKCVFRL
jgi:hypothetical protein